MPHRMLPVAQLLTSGFHFTSQTPSRNRTALRLIFKPCGSVAETRATDILVEGRKPDCTSAAVPVPAAELAGTHSPWLRWEKAALPEVLAASASPSRAARDGTLEAAQRPPAEWGPAGHPQHAPGAGGPGQLGTFNLPVWIIGSQQLAGRIMDFSPETEAAEGCTSRRSRGSRRSGAAGTSSPSGSRLT